MPEKPRRRLGTIREDAEIREDADRARSIDPTSRRPPPPREATDAQICRRRPTLLPPPLAAASAGRGGLARSASRGGGRVGLAPARPGAHRCEARRLSPHPRSGLARVDPSPHPLTRAGEGGPAAPPSDMGEWRSPNG